MSTDSCQSSAAALPPQKPGIPRLDEDARGGIGTGSVQASVSCGDLPGLARSMCYASKGIKY
ncbi:hypothetical protein [Mycolicibacterium sp. HK-90]|uniref:hypothetical protein n=1 Tax=Mycolicibacterium sp. HK-90 TaxID=3056937 RepID=UPI002659C129|nr:hypothetical protein [Mycolicibacterium sp. HK-90]WKG01257.1 hypothetical protein QU592_18425 [Mycolicibacterium sp. HK-90]